VTVTKMTLAAHRSEGVLNRIEHLRLRASNAVALPLAQPTEDRAVLAVPVPVRRLLYYPTSVKAAIRHDSISQNKHNAIAVAVPNSLWANLASVGLGVLWNMAIAAVIIALFASPAFAQSDRAYRLALAGAVTAHGLDATSSAWCLGAGTCREMNPILRPLSDTPLAFGAAKMGIAAASLLATDALRRRGHRKAAFWIAVGQSVAFTYIAVRNVRSTSQ
jgi:hypothetical protein